MHPRTDTIIGVTIYSLYILRKKESTGGLINAKIQRCPKQWMICLSWFKKAHYRTLANQVKKKKKTFQECYVSISKAILPQSKYLLKVNTEGSLHSELCSVNPLITLRNIMVKQNKKKT